MNLQTVHAAMLKRAAEENKSFGDKWYEYNQAKMEADPGVMIGKWLRNKFAKKPAPQPTTPAPAPVKKPETKNVPGSYEPGRPGGAFKPDKK